MLLDGVATAYAYDDAGQLTQAGADTFAYDPAGNRAGVQVGPANRVVNDGTWTYTYDAAGQVAGKQGAAGTWVYAYDHRGQLTGGSFAAADSSPGSAVEYRYDALGNRVARTQTVAGATAVERFGYDGWDTAKPDPVGGEGFDAWADVDANGAVTARRAFGAGFDDLVVRRDAAGAAGWYLGDRQGSVRRVVTGAGATVGAATYAGFGARTVTAGVVDRYGYAGREWDGVLGLHYGRARMYDPAAGRWASEDPIGFAAGDPNLHRYVGNAPTNATDPSGLQPPPGPYSQTGYWQFMAYQLPPGAGGSPDPSGLQPPPGPGIDWTLLPPAHARAGDVLRPRVRGDARWTPEPAEAAPRERRRRPLGRGEGAPRVHRRPAARRAGGAGVRRVAGVGRDRLVERLVSKPLACFGNVIRSSARTSS